jgi:hypothetical protein
MTRVAKYQNDAYGHPEYVNTESELLLEEASRVVRIRALTLFPALVKAILADVNAGLKAIEDAEKFVK